MRTSGTFTLALATLITSLSQIALAQNESTVGKIRQVFVEQNRAIGEITTAAVSTNDFVITFDDKSQCVLKAVDRKDRLVSLDLSSCAQKFDVKAGMIFEPSLLFGATSTVPVVAAPVVAPAPVAITAAAVPAPIATPPSVVTAPAEASAADAKVESSSAGEPFTQFGFGLSYSPQATLEFRDGFATGVNGKFDSTMKFGKSTMFSLDLRKLRKQGWGYIAALNLDQNREVSSLTISNGGQSSTVQYQSGGATLSATVVELNATYLWNQFYFPFGLNYAVYRFQPASGYTGGYEISGGLGAQLGIGYYLTPNLAFEMWSRASVIRLKLKPTPTQVTDLGEGTNGNVAFGVKFLF